MDKFLIFIYGYLTGELDGGIFMKKATFFTAKNIATLAVLLALVIVLQAFGGSFQIGVVTLNFALIPLVLGAIMLGARAGALLGFVSGFIVLMQVITAGGGLYQLMWANSPIVTTLTCLVKTTVAGYVAGLVFGIIKKKNTLAAVFTAAGLVPVVNTGLFILGCLCMWNTMSLAAAGENVFKYIIVGIVTVNFFVELAINLLVAPALHSVYRVVEKQFSKKRR